MLEGWYCRTMANEQAAQQDETSDPNENSGSDDEQVQRQTMTGKSDEAEPDYKEKYRQLKRKFKFLIYENESFQEALRVNQRRLLKIDRDSTFLLERLLMYEKPENTSSESEETESSDDDATPVPKRYKLDENTSNAAVRGRKRKGFALPPVTADSSYAESEKQEQQTALDTQQGHMTAAEVERHLQSRQTVMELMPERAPATVPTEMFSNEPSLDSESNDHIIDGSSPTHVAAEECVPMEYVN
ncbi:uncharacterized protein LOC119670420 [Teleopsis dalmanni]|uniref:uncharacterized protein LOC119670420 n=1 Tax=Teleopsis dalmanni TaxID=139649 RepID=UPI0018CE7F06|nr:uncharacterized protein LOC119670420 [Teleopsis dalmanni]